jgi:hypothetical protein
MRNVFLTRGVLAIKTIAATENILKTMYVDPVALVSLVSLTATVLPENAVILMINVPQIAM